MKQICLALLPLLLLLQTKSSAQSADDMKKWMDYMTPSDMHKMLARSDGEWKENINMWMAPGTPPQQMESACNNKMILGGRYQESIHTGMMNGMPFEGHGTLAYDNARKVFISTWIDNFGTGVMTLEGTWDEKTNTVTLVGKSTDPFTGKELPVKEVMKLVNDNTQYMEMYNTTVDGKEYKSMEMTLTRK